MSWLIDPQRLIAEGPAPDLALLEASVLKVTDAEGKRRWVSGRAAFADSHVAGARFADLIVDFSEPSAATEFTHARADRFAAAAARLGVGPRTRVVVYDRTDGIWAARLWLTVPRPGFRRRPRARWRSSRPGALRAAPGNGRARRRRAGNALFRARTPGLLGRSRRCPRNRRGRPGWDARLRVAFARVRRRRAGLCTSGSYSREPQRAPHGAAQLQRAL